MTGKIPKLLLTAILLFAFGAGSLSAGGAKETPAPAAKAAAAPAAPVTLTVWVGSWYKDQIPLIVESYKKDRPNVVLQIEPLAINGYMEKAVAATIGGNPPDIVDLDAVMISSMAGKNLLQPWDDYIKDLDVKDFASGIWSAGLLNGKVYALANRNASTVYFYNKTMFDKAGLPYPKDDWTYDDMLEIARKLTIPGQQYGASIAASLSDPANVMSSFAPVLWGMGGDFLDPTNTKAVLDQPNSVKAIKYWTELYTKHKVVPEGSINYSFTKDVVPMFAANKVALFPGSSAQFAMLKDFKDLKWGVVTCPQKWNRGGGWSFTIPTGAKQPAAARDFALWFVKPENLGRLAIREPARKSATNVAPWNTEEFKPVFAASSFSRLTPIIPQWTDMQTMIITELQKILQGSKSPEQGAADMNAQANALLKK
jgi:multiple sugar transport system substrate-binding protein